MACEQVFVRQLRQRGFRMTPQREIILSVLHDVEGLATADEIYSKVHRISAAVDISTVYRTLDLLQELDLVYSMEQGGDQRRFELVGTRGPHLHLVCRACGQVTGAGMEAAQVFSQDLQARYGFMPALDHLSVPGLCSNCAASEG